MSDRGATLSYREHLFGDSLETLLPAGLAIRVGLEDELSSMTNRPGDEFSAWIEDPLEIGGIRLLSSAGATNVMLVTLLMPVIALLAGAALLGEAVTGRALAGMALIGAGLLAIDGRLVPRRLIFRPRATG